MGLRGLESEALQEAFAGPQAAKPSLTRQLRKTYLYVFGKAKLVMVLNRF
jgi:hypothetical protein